MHSIFMVGTAGSGKSYISASLKEWLERKGVDVAVLNLDPGAYVLPYEPDVDVRDYVNIEELMEKFQLGPNGALVVASDLIADQIERINDEVAEVNPDYLLVDTPGQMELFAFRASGPAIAQNLEAERKAVLYLFDAPYCARPFNYVSNLFLAVAVYVQFQLPQINVLSKMDLLPREKLLEILKWSTVAQSLEAEINREGSDSIYLLTKDIFKSIARLRMDFSLIACSAKTLDNFVDLHAAIQRILERGEDSS